MRARAPELGPSAPADRENGCGPGSDLRPSGVVDHRRAISAAFRRRFDLIHRFLVRAIIELLGRGSCCPRLRDGGICLQHFEEKGDTAVPDLRGNLSNSHFEIFPDEYNDRKIARRARGREGACVGLLFEENRPEKVTENQACARA